jgi:hypothetical protein
LVIQPSGWHPTVIPLGRFLLHIVLGFRMMYGGNLLATVNATSMIVARIFTLPDVVTADFAPSLTVEFYSISEYIDILSAFAI